MLASDSSDDPNFAPEPFDQPTDQLAIYNSMCDRPPGAVLRDAAARARRRRCLNRCARAEHVLGLEGQVFRTLSLRCWISRSTALRTRIHGDYHLGQVLYTGDGFL